MDARETLERFHTEAMYENHFATAVKAAGGSWRPWSEVPEEERCGWLAIYRATRPIQGPSPTARETRP